MQNPIRSGHSAKFANRRFQQPIAQQALHRATSNASQRILSRDPTQISPAPSLLDVQRPKPQGRRPQTAPGHLVRIPSTMIEKTRVQQGMPTGQTLPIVPKQRQYAQASRILRNSGKRAPVPGASPWPPGSVFEYGSPANRQLSRRIESRLDALADWLRGPFVNEVRHSKEKEALVGMAKKDKRTGINKGDMQGYKDLNKGLPDPFDDDDVRGPEKHPNRPSPQAKRLHGHVGPVDHIPVE